MKLEITLSRCQKEFRLPHLNTLLVFVERGLMQSSEHPWKMNLLTT